MKKKILALILLAAMVLSCTGCQRLANRETTAAAENNTGEENNAGTETTASEINETEEETTRSVEWEQEAGAAQEAANEIDAMHEKETLPEKSVAEAEFTQKKLLLDESADWIRISSENRENGSCTEKYAYDADLIYSWSYTPDVQNDSEGAVAAALDKMGWFLAGTEKNKEMSDKLGVEVCNYSAYEDDNGYSMLHEGVCLNTADGYYLADFSMIEGNMGLYYEVAHTLLEQVYIEE